MYIKFVKHFHFIAAFLNKDQFADVNSKLLVVSGRMAVWIVLLYTSISVRCDSCCYTIAWLCSLWLLLLYHSMTVLTVTLVALPQPDCAHRVSYCYAPAWLCSLWLLLLYPSLTVLTVSVIALPQPDCAHCVSYCYAPAWLSSLWLSLFQHVSVSVCTIKNICRTKIFISHLVLYEFLRTAVNVVTPAGNNIHKYRHVFYLAISK
jgi:hypothetical protein